MPFDSDYPHSDVTGRIIGAAMAVHSALGPGLLESFYQEALAVEFDRRGIRYGREVAMRGVYGERVLGRAFRADFIVDDAVVVELKALERLDPVHVRQLLSYLHASGLGVGLLLNFGVRHLRDGIKRLVAS